MPSSPSPAGGPPAPARAAPCARTRFGGSGESLLPSLSGSFSGTASRNPNDPVELRRRFALCVTSCHIAPLSPRSAGAERAWRVGVLVVVEELVVGVVL